MVSCRCQPVLDAKGSKDFQGRTPGRSKSVRPRPRGLCQADLGVRIDSRIAEYPRLQSLIGAELTAKRSRSRCDLLDRISGPLAEVRHQHCDFDIVFSFFFWTCFVFNCDRLKTRCSADQAT